MTQQQEQSTEAMAAEFAAALETQQDARVDYGTRQARRGAAPPPPPPPPEPRAPVTAESATAFLCGFADMLFLRMEVPPVAAGEREQLAISLGMLLEKYAEEAQEIGPEAAVIIAAGAIALPRTIEYLGKRAAAKAAAARDVTPEAEAQARAREGATGTTGAEAGPHA